MVPGHQRIRPRYIQAGHFGYLNVNFGEKKISGGVHHRGMRPPSCVWGENARVKN